MDNFAHEQHTLSSIGGSNDTILMLFRNNDNLSEDHEIAPFSTKTVFEQAENCRSLEDIMDCQRLKFTNRHSDRATIPSSFIPTLPIDWSNTIGTSDELYRLRVLFCHTKDPIEYKASLLLQRLTTLYSVVKEIKLPRVSPLPQLVHILPQIAAPSIQLW